jgi:hypothetical protein
MPAGDGWSRWHAGTTAGDESFSKAFAGRFVLSIMSECLERMVPMGKGHVASFFEISSVVY